MEIYGGMGEEWQMQKWIRAKNQTSSVSIVRRLTEKSVGVAYLKKKRIIGTDAKILFGNMIFRRVLR